MNFVDIIIGLVKAATLCNDSQKQKQADHALAQMRQNDTHNFFLHSVHILKKDAETNVKQATGTLLSVSLRCKSDDKYFWDRLSIQNKKTFKDIVLSVMFDKERVVRRAAASIIAGIACIQIRRDEWTQIIDYLVAIMAKQQQQIVREVSIMTIGFICEQLKEVQFTLKNIFQQKILLAIVMVMKQEGEISEYAFKALRDCFYSLSFIVGNNQYRQFILQQIAESITQDHCVEYSIQCLIEFVRHFYQFMNITYVEAFYRILESYLRNWKEEQICILAIQFWRTLAEEQRSKDSNLQGNTFLNGHIGQGIVTILLELLCTVDIDKEDNKLSQSVGYCLEEIFDAGSNQYQVKVLNFVGNTIKHENWKYRQASIRAFSALLIGLNADRRAELLNAIIPSLPALLNDSNLIVQIESLKALNSIAEMSAITICRHESFYIILEIVLTKLSINENILQIGCKIVDYLSDACFNNKQKKLANVVEEVIKIFIDYGLNDSRSFAGISSCMTTVISLIKSCGNNKITLDYLDWAIQHMEFLGKITSQKKQLYASSFLTIIQMCLIWLRGTKISHDKLAMIYQIVINRFIEQGFVDSDGIYVVGALGFFYADRKLVNDFWKYITMGLKKIDEQDVFRAVVSYICDFAASYKGQYIEDLLDPAVEELLNIFQAGSVTLKLKLDILMCFGELALQCPKICVQKFQRIVTNLLVCCQFVRKTHDLNLCEMVQEIVVETFTCFLHGLSEVHEKKVLQVYIEPMTKFVEMTTVRSRHPKLNYIISCLYLVSDLKGLFPNQLHLLSVQKLTFIMELFGHVQRFNQKGQYNKVILYMRKRFNI